MSEKNDAIKTILENKIAELDRNIISNRKISNRFLLLSTLPFILAMIIAFQFIHTTTNPIIGIVLCVCAIGLTIVIWNLGGDYRERSRQDELESKRLQ